MTMKKSILGMQLLNNPMRMDNKSNHESSSDVFNSRTTSFSKINTENLGEPFCYKIWLKPINGAIFLVLSFIDRFRADLICIDRP